MSDESNIAPSKHWVAMNQSGELCVLTPLYIRRHMQLDCGIGLDVDCNEEPLVVVVDFGGEGHVPALRWEFVKNFIEILGDL